MSQKPLDTEMRVPAAEESAAQPAGRPQISPVVQIVGVTLAIFSLAVVALLLTVFAASSGSKSAGTQQKVSDVTIMDKFDMYMTNKISDALEGVVSIKRVYWLSDSDLVAPEPGDHFGTAEDPSELQEIIDGAAELLDGQELLFNADTPVWNQDKIYYYYDETILVITWKQVIDDCIYTISEIKVADPSQFRRFLADGEFGSDKQYVTTDMAKSVNAVVATSGDFYKFRQNGISVYEGKVERFDGKTLDTCFINEEGELLFAYRGTFATQEEAQQYVDDNHIRFSLAFGPVLVDDGAVVTTESYAVGQINEEYSRAAVCQKDELHYLFVNVCGEPKKGYTTRETISAFAARIGEMGVQKAYALDGGQTTVICMDGNLISYPDWGTQRQISDIIYFATALPNGD